MDDFALRANLFYGWPDFHDKSLTIFARMAAHMPEAWLLFVEKGWAAYC